MWNDTALVLTTDHGFLLSEHDWWGKCRMPFYNEVAHIPLMIYTPSTRTAAGRRCQSLTQTIDLAPTLLDYFGQKSAPSMTGRSLLNLLNQDHPLREVALYGIFGGSINVTDGRYTYFGYPDDMSGRGLYEYTLMPTHMNRMFSVEQLRSATLAQPFDFTQGVQTLRIEALRQSERPDLAGGFLDTRSKLYDLKNDYAQKSPIKDSSVIQRLRDDMDKVLRIHDAPREVFLRHGLNPAEARDQS
jgi:hypothetical protein